MAGEKPNDDQHEIDFPDLDFSELEEQNNQEVDDEGGEGSNTREQDADDKKASDKNSEEGSKKQDQEVELTEVEQAAYAQGWRPKDVFVKEGGDPRSWRPADWWLDRGELLNQNRQTARELREIKQAFVKMSQANADAYLKGKQDGIKQLKAERKQAMVEGNLEQALEIEEKIEAEQEELSKAQQASAAQVQKQAQGPSQEYLNWLSQNQWYTQDEDLHHMANSWMQVFVQYNKEASPQQALDELSKYIRKARPEKFGSGPRITQPQAEGRGKSTKSGESSQGGVNERLKKILGDMDPISRRIATDMIKSGDMTKEEYVKMYDR